MAKLKQTLIMKSIKITQAQQEQLDYVRRQIGAVTESEVFRRILLERFLEEKERENNASN